MSPVERQQVRATGFVQLFPTSVTSKQPRSDSSPGILCQPQSRRCCAGLAAPQYLPGLSPALSSCGPALPSWPVTPRASAADDFLVA